MKSLAAAALLRIQLRRWLALPASIGLGLVFTAALLALLAPWPGVAAAAPAVVYPCSEAGLIAALGAGGSATFNCGGPVTVTLSSRKTVTHDVTLDGGNLLTLNGETATGVFSIPAGVHLSLLNLTLFNANGSPMGGAIFNEGRATITHTHFFSNSAGGGSALYNAPGSAAFIGNSLVDYNLDNAGAVWNGDANVITDTASLTVVHTTFAHNVADQGAAVVVGSGPVWITGSTFYANHARVGGAIYAVADLTIDNSDFNSNTALLPASAQADLPAAGLSLPTLSNFAGGGAIGIEKADLVQVSSSHFSGNIAASQGGAILFQNAFASTNAPAGNAPLGTLVIAGSTFVANCTGGAGGAVANGLSTIVINSSFSFNHADATGSPCLLSQAAQPSAGTGQPALPAGTLAGGYIGAGGAIFNFAQLSVSGSDFLTNTASVTTAGGGGAISTYGLTDLHVDTSQFFGNEALNDGGAIFGDVISNIWIDSSDFRRNIAQEDAGGALASVGYVTVTASSFSANGGAPHLNGWLSGGGGAIFSGGPNVPINLSNANGAASAGQPALASQPQLLVFSSSLYVAHSMFEANSSEYEGGAIDAANATIIASTFTSNTAAYGGAIDVLADGFVISASTFIANAAVTTTVNSAQEGGAIDTNGYAVTVINSTFYANRATGGARGGAINGGTLVLASPTLLPSSAVITNSTFLSNSAETPGNGGALANNADFLLHNVLVANSAGGNCEFSMSLSGANLEFPGTTCGGASVQANPNALPPANNGGPTLTSALPRGSPAIDAGDNTGCPATDQRGAHRPVNGDGLSGAECDLGAYEAQPWLFLPLVMR